MPLYRCVVPAAALPTERRAALADAVTTIHCDVTGAPETFVPVFFFDGPEPGAAPRYQVHGSIRAGRTDEQHDAIRGGIRDAVVRIAGASDDDVQVTTGEIPASWVMEGGVLMPEPGDEERWMAEHLPQEAS